MPGHSAMGPKPVMRPSSAVSQASSNIGSPAMERPVILRSSAGWVPTKARAFLISRRMGQRKEAAAGSDQWRAMSSSRIARTVAGQFNRVSCSSLLRSASAR